MVTLFSLGILIPLVVGCGLAGGSMVVALRDANRQCGGYF